MAMNLRTSGFRFVAVAFCAFAATVTMAKNSSAQTYPSKTITLVVPSPPAGGPDIWARIIADKLQSRLGQNVIVDNRPGVGGLTGARIVAQSSPDGYNLLVTANTLGTAALIFKKDIGGLDVNKDITPFISLGLSPVVMVVNQKLGVSNIKELVALAKKPPGLTFASSGVGTLLHMAGELFNESAGIKMTHIPYPGAAQAINDLIGGRVDVLFTGYAAVAPQLNGDGPNKLIALGMVNHGRSALAPSIPTFEEQGYNGVDAIGWYGVYAPTGVPQDIINKLNTEINAILKLPDVQKRGVETGLDITGGTQQEAVALYKKDYDVFSKVIEKAGITAQ